MSASDAAVLTAAVLAALAALGAVVATVVLTWRIRELRAVVERLEGETVPMLRDARIAADQAATEMVRVGDVLASAEAVSSTVDSASRLAYRAFANPFVKLVAFWSGLGGALRRLFGRPARAPRPARSAAVTARAELVAPGDGHRRGHRRRERRVLEARS
ncbi:MAG TPA: hypothetical protein VMU09_05920 [Acidimicrobiales bacterium]|nr:hypothetical protein [Acidimicrobiales bacterium]